ncbi:glycerophosphodiester phosphodiesterase [Phormidium sp. CCY1219]|uniref:glycerophosphodiester phosphodiesterase n=1 Tax=Phormidium sp. CCY1219 TaxID=2886104 RepID=UPI002D1F7705|nr:glycerophosphodiester phosphodiesterase family protein [Phormidium sp. CCY1219]MEB3827222.1 glycerophosphodiester phosphodiesterase [Phormidium sp. CCY1219]
MEVEIIAHRGFSSIAPENTLAAFSAAIEHQADSIEFDVQLSADGVPVVFHDATLTRITGTLGKVRKRTVAQLKDLDAGVWFSDRYRAEPIPTLKEALIAIESLKKFLYLEVKTHRAWSDTQIDELVDLLLELGWANRCILASFNPLFIDRVRQRADMLNFGYIVSTRKGYRTQLVKAANAGNTVIMSAYPLLLKYPGLIKASQERGVDVVAWTVDKPKDFQKLVELGVVRIETNCLIGPGVTKKRRFLLRSRFMD